MNFNIDGNAQAQHETIYHVEIQERENANDPESCKRTDKFFTSKEYWTAKEYAENYNKTAKHGCFALFFRVTILKDLLIPERIERK